MTIHILKLSVGSESIEGLAEWQATRMEQRRRAREPIETWHRTRMFPRRKSEVLDGGSIYWVIRGLVLVRQRIIDHILRNPLAPKPCRHQHQSGYKQDRERNPRSQPSHVSRSLRLRSGRRRRR